MTLRGKYSPDGPVAYGAPVRCPRYVPGEIITSVVHGTNADLLRQVAKLWICPQDRLVDVTAGNGTFWSDTDVQPMRSNIRLLPRIDLIADCRKLPYPDASMDVVVFDPPYQPVHGQPERSFGVGRSYGLTGGPVVLQAISDVLGLYEVGIAECARVLVSGTGRLLVKCPDMTDNRRLHLVSLDVLRQMIAAGVDLADHFILVKRSRMPQPTQRQQRAHRAHSYLWVGVKEPGTPSGEQRRAVERARELAQAAATVQTLAADLGDSTQDPGQFLGWQSATPPGRRSADFYFRQLRDWKYSAEIDAMNAAAMTGYGRMCGWTLARAHARTGDRIAVAAYLGGQASSTRP